MTLYLEINETSTANYTMLSARARKRVMKGVFHAIGVKWTEEMLPQHFKVAAAARYGYAKRTEKYLARKYREKRSATPLVYSGLLKHSLLDFKQRVMSFPTRVTVRLVGPSYLNINYKPGRPNIAKEILAVTSDERQQLVEHGHDVMFKLLEKEAAASGKRRRFK